MIGFLYVEGIRGEVSEPAHAGWMELLSVEQAIHRPIEHGLPDPSEPDALVFFEDIAVTKYVDLSTPKFAETIACGASLALVRIHLFSVGPGGDGLPYLRWELRNVRVSSYTLRALDNAHRAIEQISFHFDSLRQVYARFDPDNVESERAQYSWRLNGNLPDDA